MATGAVFKVPKFTLLLTTFESFAFKIDEENKISALKPNRLLLFEMLRSFVTLARTLNLSETVTILGSTRQTVRRHIDILEHHKGSKLFDVKNRRYQLTKTGLASLKEAEVIVSRGLNWLTGQTENFNGLEYVKMESSPQNIFFSQQHPLSRLWIDGAPLLQFGFQCWAKGKTSIESVELSAVRPYWLIYRYRENDWVCVEIGEQSSYASWFGWAWAKSSVGTSVQNTPAGGNYADLIVNSYNDVYESGGVRLDHIHAQMPREKDGKLTPVSIQRLLLGCTFPNNERALAVVVARSYNIKIDGLSEEKIKQMPENFLTEFDPPAEGT